jgi:hypothetical protein
MRAPALLLAGLVVANVLGAGDARAARPDDPSSDELFRFAPGDVVEQFDSANFRVHYTRAGTHAVPLADADGSGVPDHVEQVSAIYEEVLEFYTTVLGYREPLGDASFDPEGDGRFDVYLVDFGRRADGAFRSESCVGGRCAGFMVQENDFSGYGYPSVTYANRLLASHEFFHAVQASYSAGQGSIFGEGTAVWASEQFDPSLDDLEIYGGIYLEQTDRPLNSGSGAVDSFTYSGAIFWQWFAEQLGDDAIRRLWEACADAPGADWFDLIDGVIVELGGPGFADLFTEFAIATLMTGSRADPSRSFADGASFPKLSLQGETLPFFSERFLVFTSAFRTLGVNPGGRAQVRAALVGQGENVDGVRLVVTTTRGEVVGEIIEDGTLDVTVDATGIDFVLVQIINTRQSGNGARPAVCLGSSAEVDDCLLALAAPPIGPPPPPDDPPAGCAGCASGAGEAAAPSMALWAAVLFGVRRRRAPAP